MLRSLFKPVVVRPARALARCFSDKYRQAPDVLVCDIQERFKPLIHGFDRVALTAATLIEFAKMMGRRVLVTEQNPERLGATVPIVANALAGSTHVILPKMSFAMPSMHEAGKQSGNKFFNRSPRMVIVGIEAHVCVQQTVLAYLSDGVEMTILADGVSSQRRFDRSVALSRLARKGADVTTLEAFVMDQVGTADAAEFKQVSQLLKKHNAAAAGMPELSLQ